MTYMGTERVSFKYITSKIFEKQFNCLNWQNIYRKNSTE